MAAFSWALGRFGVFLGMGEPPLEIGAYSSGPFFPFRLKQNTSWDGLKLTTDKAAQGSPAARSHAKEQARRAGSRRLRFPLRHRQRQAKPLPKAYRRPPEPVRKNNKKA